MTHRPGAVWGILGMLAGAGLYAETFPWVKGTVLTWGDYGKITLPQLLGLNHWIVIAVIVAASIGLFFWFEKKHL